MLLIEAPLCGTREHWLSNNYMNQYLTLLLKYPQVQFDKPNTIKPSTLLPDDDPWVFIHEFQRMKDEVRYLRPAVVTSVERN